MVPAGIGSVQKADRNIGNLKQLYNFCKNMISTQKLSVTEGHWKMYNFLPYCIIFYLI